MSKFLITLDGSIALFESSNSPYFSRWKRCQKDIDLNYLKYTLKSIQVFN